MKDLLHRFILFFLGWLLLCQPAHATTSSDTIKSIPFAENWDSGNFSDNNWVFPWMQGNWVVDAALGNPAPCARFAGSPSQSNYIYALRSPWFDATELTCDKIFLEFDLKLENLQNTGTERFKVILEYDSLQETVFEIYNTIGFEWKHKNFPISRASRHLFRIWFIALGQNSNSIGKWMVDNISVTRECRSPENVNAYPTGGVCSMNGKTCRIKIEWAPPDCNTNSTIQHFIFDDGTNENGWCINPGYVAWIGNEFPISASFTGLLSSIDLYFQHNASAGTQQVTLDIFDGSRNLAGSSMPFTPPDDDWLTVDLPFVPFQGMFYAMVKWNFLNAQTNYLGTDENGPYSSDDLAWYSDGTDWERLSVAAGSNPSVALLRATAMINGKKKMLVAGSVYSDDSTQVFGYNIYRQDYAGSTEYPAYSKINSTPVQDLHFHDTIACQARYYVTTVYADGCESPPSEIAWEVGCFIGMPEATLDDKVSISPNPADRTIGLTSQAPMEEVVITDLSCISRKRINANRSLSAEILSEDLPDGLYLLYIKTSKGIVHRKVVVLHQ